MIHAAAFGSMEVCRCLIDHGADVNAKDGDGRAAIHHAVMWGKKDVVRLLVERGALLDLPDADGATPLHYTVRHGYPDLCRLLLEKGADALMRDKHGNTAVDSAGSWRTLYPDIARMLRRQDSIMLRAGRSVGLALKRLRW